MPAIPSSSFAHTYFIHHFDSLHKQTVLIFFQELFSQIECDVELIIPLDRCWRFFIAMGHLHPQRPVSFELHHRDSSTTHTPFPHPSGVSDGCSSASK